MVSIIVPQPQRATSAASAPQNVPPTFKMPSHSEERFSLVTPSLEPLEASVLPPPLPMKPQRPATLSISIPDTSTVSEVSDPPPSKPESATKVSPPSSPKPSKPPAMHPGVRINKFVRRLHDMLQAEQKSGIVEWRRGLLVLHSTAAFTKQILPRYFNTRNFKTLRRQLNYYGFVHVRSFSTTGSTTTALWVNQDLAKRGTADISSVLMLKRVEPCESAKSVEGRRLRKELAVSTVEEDIGVSAKSLQLDQIRAMALRQDEVGNSSSFEEGSSVPSLVHCHANATTKTTIEGGPLSAPDFSSGTSWLTAEKRERSMSYTDGTVSTESSYDDDAANLLLALSKSNAATSSL